ncbi:tRNA (adenosine(37)-N6)-dimethylallyltransferase MiaA [Persicitalea jodogahamensis]|uniref:tRNA dimethylallyltransferase n=1 Tax=Persicitalea jodogahamensis TaxID=402147 RepID=A0A8J3D5W5_9BACT|nr:tRNA (adenosine(37)-N6)-dimethylallyltransferase MiaA [Persicitalea jodogahamensis]GHB79223.1 tRNA dimethylallyltransferase 2 [Persicitalea jodogahamensis]
MIVILGPTASGKTHLAAQLAHRIGGEIISADSRQVYRGMNIGTGKDLDEYVVDGAPIPYHLIDIVDAGEKYNVHQFQLDVQQVLPEIEERGNYPILCGGSGLYLNALLQGHSFTGIPTNPSLRDMLESYPHEVLLKEFGKKVTAYSPIADTSTKKRTIRAIEINNFLDANPDFPIPETELPDFRVFGIDPSTNLRRERISRRLKERFDNGLIDEVKGLLDQGVPAQTLIYYGLEYKLITQYLNDEMILVEMKQRLETEIHRFAKRQMTFFRKMEKDGVDIRWLRNDQTPNEWVDTIADHLDL